MDTENLGSADYAGMGGPTGFYDAELGSGFLNQNTAPLSEHMDTGAARLEETLEMLNLRYQTLFFVSATLIVINAIFNFLGSLSITEFPALVMASFLIVNGVMIMILDVPGTPKWAARYRRGVRKNVRFLTRLTGKSVWLATLGATLLTTSKSCGALRMAFCTLSAFVVFGAAIMGFLIAVRKSLKLERVKGVIKDACKGAYIDCYRKYALGDPDYGMQFEEFNRMCADHTSGLCQFDIIDLYIIFNVLDECQKCAINEREFYEWMAGSLVFL